MNTLAVPPPRKLWVRLLLMVLATDSPNARLQLFGRSLGRYLARIAAFESFATETRPFPFSEWPAPQDLSGV